jgi:hypothetical protein
MSLNRPYPAGRLDSDQAGGVRRGVCGDDGARVVGSAGDDVAAGGCCSDYLMLRRSTTAARRTSPAGASASPSTRVRVGPDIQQVPIREDAVRTVRRRRQHHAVTQIELSRQALSARRHPAAPPAVVVRRFQARKITRPALRRRTICTVFARDKASTVRRRGHSRPNDGSRKWVSFHATRV